MLDNDLIQLFYPIIIDGLAAQNIPDVVVQQSNQPTQQGANTAATVFFTKISDIRYGFPKRESVTNINTGVISTLRLQQYQTTFQINAMVIQNPANTIALTAADLLNFVADILQNDVTIAELNAVGVGILRVTTINNPYAIDDKGRFEASPSFDFTLTHTQQFSVTTPPVDNIAGGLYRV